MDYPTKDELEAHGHNQVAHDCYDPWHRIHLKDLGEHALLSTWGDQEQYDAVGLDIKGAESLANALLAWAQDKRERDVWLAMQGMKS